MSIILKYDLEGGITCLWMGDLETDFMERIAKAVTHDKADVLFAPHHGRKSGRVLNEWLNLIDPQIIVVGEALSQDLEYYSGFNTITQLSAGDILFECLDTKVHVFVSSPSYSVDFLSSEGVPNSHGFYLGTFYPRT